MDERDFYPDGEKAPGIVGELRDWVPPKNFKADEARPYTDDELRAQGVEVGPSVPPAPIPPGPPPPAPQPQPFTIGEFPTLGAALKAEKE